MQALDLVRLEGKSGDYSFKHALVRDALYQSLLSEARTALHLKIAEEIERRSGNRLAEVAEVLAHHYSQTDRCRQSLRLSRPWPAAKASASIPSTRQRATSPPPSLSSTKIRIAPRTIRSPSSSFSYTLLLNMTVQLKAMIDVLDRYLARIDRLATIRELFSYDITMYSRFFGIHAIEKLLPCSAKLR